VTESAEPDRGGPTARRYPWIDLLRFIAALAVLGFHLIGLKGNDGSLPAVTGWLGFGFLGVDLFFAISGTVIMLSMTGLQALRPGSWRTPFALRRAARLIPLYWLTSLLFIVVVNREIAYATGFGWQVLSHVLFVHNLFGDTHGSINAPSWSLGVEVQYYVLMLLIGGVLVRVGSTVMLLASLSLSLAWRLAVLQSDPPGIGPFFLATQLPGVIDTFIVGMLVGRWAASRRRPAASSRAALLPAFAAITLSAVSASMMLRADDYWREASGFVLSHFFVSLAAGAWVAFAIALPAPGVRVSSWLQRCGDLSYGVYLWHLGVLLILLNEAPNLSSAQTAACVVAATLLLANIGWTLLERPCIAWARRIEPLRPHRATAVGHQPSG
jgi:peptidoglycan/LPS O-acetylase OafA/YrhL